MEFLDLDYGVVIGLDLHHRWFLQKKKKKKKKKPQTQTKRGNISSQNYVKSIRNCIFPSEIAFFVFISLIYIYIAQNHEPKMHFYFVFHLNQSLYCAITMNMEQATLYLFISQFILAVCCRWLHKHSPIHFS